MTTYQARLIYLAVQKVPVTGVGPGGVVEGFACDDDRHQAVLAARDQYLILRRAEEAAYLATHPEAKARGDLAAHLPPDEDRRFSI